MSAEFEQLVSVLKLAQEHPRADEAWHEKWLSGFARLRDDLARIARTAEMRLDSEGRFAIERYQREVLFKLESFVFGAVAELLSADVAAENRRGAFKLIRGGTAH
jgi:hypothetical protein